MNRRSQKSILVMIAAIVFTAMVVVPVSAADETVAGFVFNPAVIGTIFLLGLFGAFKYAEQTWGSDPTKWDYLKYAQVFAAAIIVSMITYLASNVLAPATIDQITQALSLLGGSVLTILGYKTIKNVAVNGTVVNPEVVTSTQKDDATAPKPITAASAAAPAAATAPTVSAGAGKVLGIYGGSARGNPPVPQLSIDVNQIPTLFVDVQGTAIGPVAAQLIIDNVIQREFMPDNQGREAEVTLKFNNIGEIIALGFIMDQKYRTVGDHTITIRQGRFDAKGLVAEWFALDTFKLTLTGTKFT